MTPRLIRSLRLLVTALGVASGAGAWAQTGALSPQDVLQSSARHMPEILAAQEDIARAKAKQLQAQGRFDTRLEQEIGGYASGFYDGQRIDNRVVQPVPFMNSTIYGGYRRSDGLFPVYEDELVTNDGGELMMGVRLSLLRDRAIDANRVALRQAELEVLQQEAEQLSTALRVQQNALIAYWRWVVAGHRIKVQQRLLELSQTRQNQMERQVESGDIAQILLTENRQAIVKREIQLRDAVRLFELAGQDLSLFWRDADGRPLVAGREALPEVIALPAAPAPERFVADQLAERPDIRALELSVEQQKQAVALGENALLPELDLDVSMADDYGDGSRARDESELKMMLNISIPLQRRDAKGAIAKGRAEKRQLQLQQQLQLETYEALLANLRTNLQTLREQVELAEEEVTLADTMRDAEAIRFRNGDSDFFTLNLREEQLAETNLRFLQLKQLYLQDRARLLALLADETQLELSSLSPDAG